MKKIRIYTIVAATAVAMNTSLYAATIAWGAATTIAADTDVSTSGTLVEAININGAAVTVNGVSFTAHLPGADGLIGTGDDGTVATQNTGYLTPDSVSLGSLGTTFTPGHASNPSTAAFSYRDGAEFGTAGTDWNNLKASYLNYSSLLEGGILANSNPTGNSLKTYTLTLGGLVIGNTYSVQFFIHDSRGNTAQPKDTFDSNGSTVTVDTNVTNSAGGLGQWVIGTFTADASTQSITVGTAGSGTPDGALPQLNAYQVRDITVVPEPAVALLGSLATLITLRRRRS